MTTFASSRFSPRADPHGMAQYSLIKRYKYKVLLCWLVKSLWNDRSHVITRVVPHTMKNSKVCKPRWEALLRYDESHRSLIIGALGPQ